MPTKNKKIAVKKSDAGERLDVFLSKKLKVSRSQIQKMIGLGQVLVNEKLPKKAGDNLGMGSVITVIPTPKEESLSSPSAREGVGGVGADTSATPSRSLLVRGRHQTEIPRRYGSLGKTPTILAETPDYIIIDKPTGMLSHPTMAHETDTVADFIIKKYPEVKNVGDPSTRAAGRLGAGQAHLRPGIVHRLDREASGLMVVARTQKMFDHLKEQFKNRTIDKEYFALVHGKVQRDWGEIDFPIARSKTNDRMAAVPLKLTAAQATATPPTPPLGKGRMPPISPSFQEGVGGVAEDDSKQAKTEFLVEKKFINFTLLRVKIHTGRMHQIRVHLLAYNHPLVGDPLYFQKKQKRTWDEKLGRLFLHSAKLGFTDLNGEKQTFESPLPQELTDFLKLLK